MLFVPFRFDMQMYRLPFVTIAVCVLCLAIYGMQASNEREYMEKTEAFCSRIDSTIDRMMLAKVTDAAESEACVQIVIGISLAEDRAVAIDGFVADAEPFAAFSKEDSRRYTRDLIEQLYEGYSLSVPSLQTKELWYHPHSWDPWSMVTASFAHGSWDHVIGNLFFFFAFAAAVEALVGPLVFASIIVAMAFGTAVSYSFAMMSVPNALPTVGLSGIVMGMMALFTFFMPNGRIRCFYWFLIKIGTVSVPAWILTSLFVGFDTVQLLTQEEQSGVNLVYHVSGAALGFVIGIAFFRRLRRDVPQLIA